MIKKTPTTSDQLDERITPHAPADVPAPQTLDAFVEELYSAIKQLAQKSLNRERAGHTLQATALAHEVYLRLSQQHPPSWCNKAYVMSAAAAVVRRVLIDHARSRGSVKRGGGWTVQELGLDALSVEPATDLLDVHEALDDLASHSERQARVVELRFFGGMNADEVASVLGISPRTVANDWRIARAWMRHRLQRDG